MKTTIEKTLSLKVWVNEEKKGYEMEIESFSADNTEYKVTDRQVPDSVIETLVEPVIDDSDLPTKVRMHVPIKYELEEFIPPEKPSRNHPGTPAEVVYNVRYNLLNEDYENIFDEWKVIEWEVARYFEDRLQEIGLSLVEEESQKSYDAHIDTKIEEGATNAKSYSSPLN